MTDSAVQRAIADARQAHSQPSKALAILRDAAPLAQTPAERDALASALLDVAALDIASLYVQSAAPELAEKVRGGDGPPPDYTALVQRQAAGTGQRRSAGSSGTAPEDHSISRWALVREVAASLDAGQVVENLFSLRVIIVSLIAGGIVGAGAEWVWQPLGVPVGLTVFVLAWLLLALSPDTVLFCPYCRKRVKLGASHCHHCGRAVS